MKFSELVHRTASLAISYRDFTINIRFFSELLTPDYRERLVKLVEEQSDLDADTQLLADLIQSWDIVDDNDQPIPVTYEFLQGCPYVFLATLARAIFGYIADTANPTQKTSPSS